jgi:hypothetical protein
MIAISLGKQGAAHANYKKLRLSIFCLLIYFHPGEFKIKNEQLANWLTLLASQHQGFHKSNFSFC